MEQCKNCGAEIIEGAQFCLACGLEVGAAQNKLCSACHKEVPEQAKFCPFCGSQFLSATESVNEHAQETLQAFFESMFSPISEMLASLSEEIEQLKEEGDQEKLNRLKAIFDIYRAENAELEPLRDRMCSLWAEIEKCETDEKRDELHKELSEVCARLGRLYRKQEMEADERQKSEEKSWGEIVGSLLSRISGLTGGVGDTAKSAGKDEAMDLDEIGDALVEKIDNLTDRVCHAIDRAGDWFTDNM